MGKNIIDDPIKPEDRHVRGQARWLAEYLHELTTFPNAKYDDQADST